MRLSIWYVIIKFIVILHNVILNINYLKLIYCFIIKIYCIIFMLH